MRGHVVPNNPDDSLTTERTKEHITGTNLLINKRRNVR